MTALQPASYLYSPPNACFGKLYTGSRPLEVAGTIRTSPLARVVAFTGTSQLASMKRTTPCCE